METKTMVGRNVNRIFKNVEKALKTGIFGDFVRFFKIPTAFFPTVAKTSASAPNLPSWYLGPVKILKFCLKISKLFLRM